MRRQPRAAIHIVRATELAPQLGFPRKATYCAKAAPQFIAPLLYIGGIGVVLGLPNFYPYTLRKNCRLVFPERPIDCIRPTDR